MPLVSIIIAAYNAEEFVLSTIESILNQSFKDLEIIIVNDGSTDNTLEILNNISDERITILSQQNFGQDAAFNFGYRKSKGAYIKFMDADDLISPMMVEIQMQILSGAKDYIAYGEWARFYDNKPEEANFEKLDYWKDMQPIDFLVAREEGIMLQCGIMLIPRAIIELSGLWDERLILLNDTEFYTRVILKSKGIKFSEGARLFYRSGRASSISSGKALKFYESTYLSINLMGELLLKHEDSIRTRSLISNYFLIQYFQFYPKFSGLGKKHEQKIKQYGYASIKADGGLLFKSIRNIAGWKMATIIKNFFYKLGYLNHIKKHNIKKSLRQ